MNTSYNPHVKSYPDYPGMKTPFISLDYSLGSLLLLCALVGIPGNILGASFFTSTNKKDRVTLLYITICCIDSVTSITHLPVTMAMFRGRKPGMFNSYLVCVVWEILYTILQKMSIFLVLLLSTSRTVAIVKPFYKMRIKTVMGCVVGYLIILVLIPLLQHIIPPLRGEYKYSWDGAYCYYNFEMKFEHAVNLVMVGLPPILTFVTLIVSITKLYFSAKKSVSSQQSKCRDSPRARTIERRKNQATITIAIFTTLFLVCNFPLFINMMHNMTTRFFGVKYPGVYFSTRFMYWYSWHIAKMESVVVNAALNPVFYYCRMKRFRKWCNLLITCRFPKSEVCHTQVGFTQLQASDTVEQQVGRLGSNSETGRPRSHRPSQIVRPVCNSETGRLRSPRPSQVGRHGSTSETGRLRSPRPSQVGRHGSNSETGRPRSPRPSQVGRHGSNSETGRPRSPRPSQPV